MGAAVKMRATATARDGFTHRFRAGLPIPRGSGNFLDFLVVEDAADPKDRLLEGQLAVGRDTLKRLQEDKELVVGPVGDIGPSTDKLAAKDDEIASLRAQVKDLTEELHKALAAADHKGKK